MITAAGRLVDPEKYILSIIYLRLTAGRLVAIDADFIAVSQVNSEIMISLPLRNT